jgi:hypothetical protein
MVDCGSWPNCGGGTDQRLLVIAALVVIGAAPGNAINPLRPVEADSNTLFYFRFRGHSRHGETCRRPRPGRK